MSAGQIVAEVKELYDIPNERRKMVVLTGGEPALQVDKPLVDALHQAGFYICIETNGTRPLPEGIDWITCSPKEGTRPALKQVQEVKVVFTGMYDPEVWREQLSAEHWMLQPLRYTGEWLMENVDSWEDDRNDNMDDTVRYILSHPFWRLSVQLHKIAGLQ
jgi:organic radical activating enzyme